MTDLLSILLVGAFPFPLHQGSQVYVRGMARALARRGHRVRVACWGHGEGEVPAGVEVVRARRIPGAAIERSGPHWSRGLHDAALIGAIRRAARATAIDVVHAHNVEAPIVARAALGRSVPVVYDQHTRMGEELPTYLRNPLTKRLAARVGGWADWAVPRACDAAVALSEAGADGLRRDGVSRVALVPPAVDLTDLDGADPARARARWGLDARPWVVYTGNTDVYQDLPLLLDALARLPEVGLLLVTGDEVARWETRCDRLGIGPARRRLVRSRSFADARDAIAASTVAAIPRRRCAGFPIKLLNTLGLGVPTVASAGSARDIPGVVAVTEEGPDAFAAALHAVVRDPSRRRVLAEAARRAVHAEWSWDARVPSLEALYGALSRRACDAGWVGAERVACVEERSWKSPRSRG